MGIIPLITITVVYAQFLYGAQVFSVTLLFLSIILYAISFIFIYSYKNTFLIENIFSSLKKQLNPNDETTKLPLEVKEYEDKILTSNVRYGNLGLAILLISSFLFVSSITIAMDMGEWQVVTGIFNLLLNGNVWLNFLYFITISFVISGAAILYFFFIWQGGLKDMDDDYKKYSQKVASYISLFSALLLPVFLILNFIFQPQTSLTPISFILTGLSVISILLICNLLYATLKNSEIKYSGAVFFLIFVTFAFSIIQQQIAFGNSIKPHLYSVTKKADELKNEITGKTISTTGVNAEEIYNTKCIACHKFDVKLVGPPYQETIPKYAGDVKKLSEFIFNPQKINAAYPPMPNQGLKQKEADAMAQWLIQKVSGK
jgi:cytochrome c